jgi:hypothetical protein
MIISTANAHLSRGSVFLTDPPPKTNETTLDIWFDAADATTITYAASPYIQAWNDKSVGTTVKPANTSGNSSIKPQYVTNFLNGKNVVYFDGDNDLFTVNPFPNLQGLTGCTYIVVYKTLSGSTPQIVTQMKTNTTGVNELYLGITSGSTFSVGMGGGLATTSNTTNINFNIHSVKFDGTRATNDTKLIYRINKVQQSLTFTTNVGTSMNANVATLHLGEAPSQINDFGGYIAEILLYTRLLSDVELANMETYLETKWGL